MRDSTIQPWDTFPSYFPLCPHRTGFPPPPPKLIAVPSQDSFPAIKVSSCRFVDTTATAKSGPIIYSSGKPATGPGFTTRTVRYAFNTSLAAKGALANRLQRLTACKIQNGRQGAPKWQRGSGRRLPLGFWAF